MESRGPCPIWAAPGAGAGWVKGLALWPEPGLCIQIEPSTHLLCDPELVPQVGSLSLATLKLR